MEISSPIVIKGSYDERKKNCISLPTFVWTYLRLQSAAKGIDMQDLVLEALIEQYGLPRKGEAS